MARRFWRHALGTLICLSRTLDEVLQEPFPLVYGTGAVFLVGGLYTVATGIGYLLGFGAGVQSWIPISAERYYLVSAPLTIALFLLLVLIYSAVVQFLSRFLGGKGSFENGEGIFGLSLWMPILPLMWLPEAAVLVGSGGEITTPPEAYREYGFQAGDEVVFLKGSRRSGGFGVGRADRIPALLRKRRLGHGQVDGSGRVIAPPNVGVQPGDRLLTVRGSGLALGLLARGPIYEEALKYPELEVFGHGHSG